jgi:hypothetical protein
MILLAKQKISKRPYGRENGENERENLKIFKSESWINKGINYTTWTLFHFTTKFVVKVK